MGYLERHPRNIRHIDVAVAPGTGAELGFAPDGAGFVSFWHAGPALVQGLV